MDLHFLVMVPVGRSPTRAYNTSKDLLLQMRNFIFEILGIYLFERREY